MTNLGVHYDRIEERLFRTLILNEKNNNNKFNHPP